MSSSTAVDISSGVSIRSYPPEIIRQFVEQSTIAVGKLHLGDNLYRPYALNKAVDRALCRLGHGPTEFDKNCKRLLINLPPQTAKTSSLVHFIAQYKAKNPDRAVIYITYNDDRAKEVGLEMRDTFLTIAPYFGHEIDKSSKSRTSWRIAGHRGNVLSKGVDQSITGFAADLIIFDDPYKGHQDAESRSERQTVLDIWEKNIRSRISEEAIVIVTQTRWHVDDLTGHLIKQMQMDKEEDEFKEFWHQLTVPAIAEDMEGNPTDIYNSWGELVVRAGESPECRKSSRMFRIEKAKIDRYAWNSLYQQYPQRAQGAMWGEHLFRNVWVDLRDNPLYYAIGIDPSMGEDMARGDYSAIIGAMSFGDSKIYVNADIQRSGPHEIIDRLIKLCFAGPRIPDAIGFEQHQFQTLIKDIGAKRLMDVGIRCDVYGMKPQSWDPLQSKIISNPKKVDRISRVLDPLLNNDLLRFQRSRGCSLLVSQMEEFPSKKEHDDGPDGLEIAIRTLRKYWKKISRGRKR